MSDLIGFDVVWTGADGSVWDLVRGPVQITDGGFTGLGFSEFDEYTRDSPLVDGQSFDGVRQKARQVFLPLLLGVDTGTSIDWLALERAWWRSVRPNKTGTLTVTAPDGQVRSVALRFVSDGGQPYKVDPALEAMSVAGLIMKADDPWWLAPEAGRVFEVDPTGNNFFGGLSGFGPPFTIVPANTTGAWTMENPGDEDAWVVWVVEGPASGFRFVIDGHAIDGTIDVPSGSRLLIDTDPTVQTALLIDAAGNVSNVTQLLDSYDYARVPAGESVPVTALVYGVGRLSVRFRPRFYRAW